MNFIKTPLAIAMGTALSLSANAIQITTNDNALELANTLTAGTGLIVTSAELSYGDFNDDIGDGYGEYGSEGTVSEVTTYNSETETPTTVITSNTSTGATSGIYTNESGTYGLPNQGIVLSTGNVLDYQDGSNTKTGKSTSWNTVATEEQSQLLSQVSGESTYRDTTLLTITFDVDENTDTVSFLGAFGSEEFPQYVGSNFIDGFGLFLNGQNIAGVTNEEGETQTANINHSSFKAIEGTQLNGLIAPNGNPLLRFDAPVEAGSTGNVFQIVIGDRGDNVLDTTTYLSKFGGEGSSELIPVMPSNGEPNENGEFEFTLPGADSGIGIETPIWIDPVVATGYTYEIKEGLFTSVVMPGVTTIDADGFELWVWNELNGEYTQVSVLANGESYDLTKLAFDVTKFQIRDIDPALALDPNNPAAFSTGITYKANNLGTNVNVTMAAMTTDTDAVTSVNEPVTLPLIALGLLALLRRRTQKA